MGSISVLFGMAVLFALSALFSASETALMSANRIRIKNQASLGNKQAKRALEVIACHDKAVSAILVGNNVVNIAASSLGTVLFISLLGDAGAWVSTIVISVLVLLFGEILPKNYAHAHSEKMLLRVSSIVYWYMKILTPIVAFFMLFTRVRRKEEDEEPTMTEDELKVMIEEIQDEGVLEKRESELVQSALDFDETKVEEVLTPRVDVCAVDIREDIETVRAVFMSEPYSRLPVYEDTIDNIVGVIHEKDLFIALTKDPVPPLSELIQQPLFVPPTKKIAALLQELQHSKTHMAVVTDQYGGTMGIITLEDILEELVGDIWDEHDQIVQEFSTQDGKVFEVSGDMNIDDMFDKLEVSPNEEIDANTVSGYILDIAERIPNQGDSFEAEGLRFTVLQVDDQRILKVLVKKITPDDVPVLEIQK